MPATWFDGAFDGAIDVSTSLEALATGPGPAQAPRTWKRPRRARALFSGSPHVVGISPSGA